MPEPDAPSDVSLLPVPVPDAPVPGGLSVPDEPVPGELDEPVPRSELDGPPEDPLPYVPESGGAVPDDPVPRSELDPDDPLPELLEPDVSDDPVPPIVLEPLLPVPVPAAPLPSPLLVPVPPVLDCAYAAPNPSAAIAPATNSPSFHLM